MTDPDHELIPVPDLGLGARCLQCKALLTGRNVLYCNITCLNSSIRKDPKPEQVPDHDHGWYKDDSIGKNVYLCMVMGCQSQGQMLITGEITIRKTRVKRKTTGLIPIQPSDHDHIWDPAHDLGQAFYRCSYTGCNLQGRKDVITGDMNQLVTNIEDTPDQPLRNHSCYQRGIGKHKFNKLR